MEIIPAIIAKDFGELERKIKLVEPYVKSVQIDVMDGIFVPNITWNNPEELKNIETGLEIEAHLMVADVEKEIGRWINSGVKRILVHYEAMEKLADGKIISELIKKCKEKNVELGLVLNLETPIEVLSDLQLAIGDLPLIQLMSIEKIGAHGYPFSEKVIPKIKALRQNFPGVKIEADGGINLQNAKQVAEAGADILVVGSAIFNSKNIEETIKIFQGIKYRIKN